MIAYAMVGITVVVIVVGAIVLKVMLAEPASPACDNLKRLSDGDKVVETVQRYLEAHGAHEIGSCRATIEALDKTLGHDQAAPVLDCLAKAKTADAAGHCLPN